MQLEHCRELPLVILVLGLYILIRGFGKAFKRRDLCPRGLLNGGAYIRGGC